MGRVYDDISEEQAHWIGEQPMFFVATAAPDAYVNVSPRGLDTFRVLGPRRVAWLDLTGSGVETIAHLRADGRITLMFCAFEGLPKILRLYGKGEVREPGDAGYEELRSRFPDLPGERAIIDVSVGRVADSCGFGVPRMDLVGPRDKLLTSAERKGPEKVAEYQALKNTQSIDGLPGLDPEKQEKRTATLPE
jgi:Pyridoxamine 5'-phosphate oxidase